MIEKMRYFAWISSNLVKTTGQLMYGVWKISQLPQPVVTIFGGSRISQADTYAKMTHDLTHLLADAHISVITGGGPGIMKAATCAVEDEHTKVIRARTLAITVKNLIKDEPVNECAKEYIAMDYFFSRKWLMINFSIAFAVFPGGFGTLDELFEVLTLLQTQSMEGVPVVLIGKDYWEPLIHWIENIVLKEGLIEPMDLSLFQVTDDLNVAFCILKERCEQCKKCVIELIN